MGLYEEMLARIVGLPESPGFPEAAAAAAAARRNPWDLPRASDLPQTMLPPHLRARPIAVDAGAPAVQSAIGNAPAGPSLPAVFQNAGMLPSIDPAAPIGLTETEQELQRGVGGPVPTVPMPAPRPSPPQLAGSEDVGARARQPAPPMQIAPASLPAAAAPTPAAAPAVGMMDGLPGILGRIRTTLGDNSNTLLALGAGMAGAPNIGQGISRAAAAAIPARAIDRKQTLDRASRQFGTQAMIDAGVPVQMAIAAGSDPDLKKALITKYFETKPAQVVNGRLVREHADGTVSTLADFGDDKKPPSGWQWKDSTKTSLEYIPDGPADPKYLREKGEKNAAPPGYAWVDPADPEKGLKAIPGGPGEKVDAQVAARIGLAKNFLKQLPTIKTDIEKGLATGIVNAGMAYTGYGRAGEIRRQIASGSEALLRNLTGAGMSLPEAQKYVSRYELQPHDTIARVKSKLEQLEGELLSTMEEVQRGRGGTAAPAAPAPGTYVFDPVSKKLVPAK